MAKAPQHKKSLDDIDIYVPGKSSLAGRKDILKLSSNETPLGPSPKAIEAYKDACKNLHRYPDGSATALRDAIGTTHKLDPARIVCGTGSDELLNLMAYAYLKEGDEALYCAHGFLVYKIAILAAGATPIVVPETNFTADVDAILAHVSNKTKLVYIANPNNPTGTYLNAEQLKKLRAGLANHIILVIDGAYAEYVSAPDYDDGVSLVDGGENTIMTRTFSKIYGLAALRLGWCYAPPSICTILNKIRGPFNVSTPAIAAGIAALEDQAHIDKARALNDAELTFLTDGLTSLRLTVTPSVANFLLVHFPIEGSQNALQADQHLQDHGIIVRQVSSYGLPQCLRITTGTRDDGNRIISALTSFMRQDEQKANT